MIAARLHSGMLVARQYRISGRVQGVGFRYFTADRAALEGLHGWVRNTPEGGVEVFAEGEAEAIERFERALRNGPRGARVDRVNVDIVTPTGRQTGFHIT